MNTNIGINKSVFLNSLLTGKRNICSKIIHEHLNNHTSIELTYEELIKKTLYKVGELWEFNKISVATEHLASAIIEAILNEIYPKVITNEKNDKKAIVACVENEFHQIGIKMVSDIFELNNWNSYFLGANTPTNELISYAKIIKPDILAISLSIYFHLPILEEMTQKIRAVFPDLPILVGGQAFLQGGQDIITNFTNVTYLPNLNSINAYIKKL